MTQETTNEVIQEPELGIVVPEADQEEERIELDYDKAFAKLPAHIKKAAQLFGYKPSAESQDKLEELVVQLKTDYETELNNSVVPLIVAKMKGDKKIEKPGVSATTSSATRKRTTTPYKGF